MYGLLLSALAALALPQEGATPPDLRCGSYCLYVGLKALDFPLGSFSELEAKLGQPTANGYSMGQLAEAAKSFGAETLGVETTLDDLRRRPGRFACISLVGGNHFVNIASLDEARAHLIDPPRDYRLPLETLGTQWDGKALLIARDPLLAEEELPRAPNRLILWIVGGTLVVGSSSIWLKQWLSST